MKPFACPCLVFFCCLSLIPAAFAQTKTAAKKDAAATTTSTTPVSPELMKARMKRPLKGTAAIEFITGKPKVANGEVQGVIRVKNVVVFPELSLLSGTSRRFGGALRARMDFTQRKVHERQLHLVAVLGQHRL